MSVSERPSRQLSKRHVTHSNINLQSDLRESQRGQLLNLKLKGSPQRGLAGATLGFFVGFAAVALFGPVAHTFQANLHLSPVMLGFVIAAPLLSGSLLRVPFSVWVDSSGGRKPFLTLLILSILGMIGLLFVFKGTAIGVRRTDFYPLLFGLGVLCGCGIATFSVGIGQVSYWFPQAEQGRVLGAYAGLGNTAPGVFSFLLPVAVTVWGISTAYWMWLLVLIGGTLTYTFVGCNAWYFQVRRAGARESEARRVASARGQEIFPAGSIRDGFAFAIKRRETWALVALYFVTFGGFLALTIWFPIYWHSYYKVAPAAAGLLTGLFSLGACFARIIGGFCADRLSGERTSRLAIYILLAGSLLMSFSSSLGISIMAAFLIAIGMGFNNAAVFKLVPKYVPDAVGGAAGWVGGLGAFGGFVMPPVMGLIVELFGLPGYAHSFLLFTGLAIGSLVIAGKLKS